MRCRRLLKSLVPLYAALPLMACESDSKKSAAIEPSMYFLVSGTSCEQKQMPFSIQMAGESVFRDAEVGYCPKSLDSQKPVARCYVGSVPSYDNQELVPQTVYYGDPHDKASMDVMEVMKEQCGRSGDRFVTLGSTPAAPAIVPKDLTLNRSNDFYSIEKEVYSVGETVRVSASQGLGPIIAFSIKNQTGSNGLRSRYSQLDKVQEIVLDPYLQPGVYEIESLTQDLGVQFYGTESGVYENRNGDKTNLKVLRFKVENTQTVDSVKPVVSAVALQSTTLKRGSRLVGTLTVSDDLSGVMPEITMMHIKGIVPHWQNNYPKVEGDNWIFEVDTVKQLPGRYVLESVSVSDRAGNEETLVVNLEFFITP